MNKYIILLLLAILYIMYKTAPIYDIIQYNIYYIILKFITIYLL
jgi:hypothetical protein